MPLLLLLLLLRLAAPAPAPAPGLPAVLPDSSSADLLLPTPAPAPADGSTNLTLLECKRRQSQCESELALQAGRASRNASQQPPGRPVCGSDNSTYANDCALQRAQCEGRNVREAYRGRCIDATPCWTFKRRLPSRASWVFVPACTPEGLYEPVQCHAGIGSGFCFCMTPRGRPVLNSTVKLKAGAPDCRRPHSKARRARPRTHPRLRPRPRDRGRGRGRGGGGGGRGRGRGRGRRGALCSRAARRNFNKRVLALLRADYLRERGEAVAVEGDGDEDAAAELNSAVLRWKFAALDRDGSGAVGRGEYSGMRAQLRRALPNNTCARTLMRRCDLDRSRDLSQPEWAACLATHTAQVPPAPVPAQESLESLGDGVLGAMAGLLLERKEEPEESNCLTDRRAVLDEQRPVGAGSGPGPGPGPSYPLYVPECLPDGRYSKLQCYNSTGYCWCVHEDTGKPIPGTSVKDQLPQCDSPTITLPLYSRFFKGCPEERRIEFLRNLREFFKLRMQAAKNETESSSAADWDTRVASWSFNVLDQNKNNILDRLEWKTFRELVRPEEALRRCGKRLPRYCDSNRDRSISQAEWRDCTRVPAPSPTPEPAAAMTTRRPKVRKGKNPIESYLKAD